MSDIAATWHISSAVVVAQPAHAEAVAEHLRRMDNVEVHGIGGSKIVVVIEGDRLGALGDRLLEISALEGVLSANMVFEHSLPQEDLT